MKGKIRKNQVVIATLAVLIAIAGYISYDKNGLDLNPNSQQANANEDKDDITFGTSLSGMKKTQRLFPMRKKNVIQENQF